MAGHDIIVIGGSAGGLEALATVLAGLPADLPAAVCVVVHQAAYGSSRRPEMLSRVSTLPVVAAEQGLRLRPGTVYIAVPDMHLLIERGSTAELGTLRVVRGPKENRARPAGDPLFRSAALAFGRRVIGVVLSGALDDGTSGLWVIKDRGGLAVVQDPTDAAVSSMPARAMEEVAVDHVAAATELGALLGRLVRLPIGDRAVARRASGAALGGVAPRVEGGDGDLDREVAIVAMNDDAHRDSDRYGVPSRFACPDCGGVLWSTSPPGSPLHLRCETGHAYSAAWLAEAQTEAVEAALWAALRALEDKAELARLRAGLAKERGLDDHAGQFDVQVQAAQQHAMEIRALLRLDGRTGIRPSTREPGARGIGHAAENGGGEREAGRSANEAGAASG